MDFRRNRRHNQRPVFAARCAVGATHTLSIFDDAMKANPSIAGRTNVADCVVLCCKSEHYFRSRIESAGGRPVVLTTQFMYPGSFILQAVAEGWLNGATMAALRARAGEAYAINQKLSRKAGLGVFAKIEEPAGSNGLQ